MKCSIIVAAFLLLPFSASGQGINDAEITAIVVTANQVDIDAGKLAVSRSSNNTVKAKEIFEKFITDFPTDALKTDAEQVIAKL